MTTNKPHIEAYLVTRIKGEGYGKSRRILDARVYDPTSDSFFAAGAKENNTVEPLVPLSKYEVLQAERNTLLNLLERSSEWVYPPDDGCKCDTCREVIELTDAINNIIGEN